MDVMVDIEKRDIKNLAWWIKNNVAIDLGEHCSQEEIMETIDRTIEAYLKNPSNFWIPEA